VIKVIVADRRTYITYIFRYVAKIMPTLREFKRTTAF